AEVRVLAVLVVLAHVDDRQLPQLSHVHHLVKQTLAQRALAEEAHGHLPAAALLGREAGTRGDAGAATHDGVRPEVAVLLVGDVHRAALAAAVAGRTPQQFGEHQIEPGALRHAVAVAAVGAGDVVAAVERLAHAHGHGLLTGVQVG